MFLFHCSAKYEELRASKDRDQKYYSDQITKLQAEIHRLEQVKSRGDYCNSIDIAGSTIVILLLLWTTIAILF